MHAFIVLVCINYITAFCNPSFAVYSSLIPFLPILCYGCCMWVRSLCSVVQQSCVAACCLVLVLVTARSKLRQVLFLALSVTCFFSLWIKYLGNGWTDLHEIHREDVFDYHSDEFECQGQKSPGIKNALCTPITPGSDGVERAGCK